ncbi:alpha/beta-hydrolase [Artomyces pyxidatus]|uniref:Alpha/beta-hydrolase n=1 Tax=Artomyces pyxidatus TaxID=48021 RepID=A0ACB8TJ33_9AGAM|nr:alpha/beta-hydrolase [Artomyces pyxidatus]
MSWSSFLRLYPRLSRYRSISTFPAAMPDVNKNWFTELASLPLYTSARFLSNNVVRVTSSTRDHVRNSKRISTKTLFFAQTPDADHVHASPSEDVSPEVQASTISPSGRWTAVLRETSGTENKRYVEVWDCERLEATLDVTSIHSTFYTDGASQATVQVIRSTCCHPDQLSSLSFNPEETALVYTAEAKPHEDGHDPFSRFRFVPAFGEGYLGRMRPTLFIAQWSTASQSDVGLVRPLLFPKASSTVWFGQARFATSHSLVATGYEYSTDGRMLGIKGCWNRPTAVWEIALDPSSFQNTTNEPFDSTLRVAAISKISDPSFASRAPRVYRHPETSHSTVFFLSHELGGPHASCSALHSFNLETRQSQLVVPLIDKVKADLMEAFAGLYLEPIARPFLRLNGKLYLVSHTIEGPSTSVILIDAEKPSTVTRLTTAKEGDELMLWSWTLLATDGGRLLLCARSSPTVPYHLVLGRLAVSNGVPSVTWTVIEKPTLPEHVEKALNSLKSSVLQIPNRYPTETIVVEPKSSDKRPLVTFIHGGPHGHISTEFAPMITALALQGYTLSLPNYTGSVGYGDFYVRKLMGQCGTLDVQDVMESVNFLVKEGKAEHGPGKQLITGGSHGGFLGAHLVGQYPDTFSAVVLRNPVISSQPASTDIPDWYFWEFGVTPSLETEQMTPDLYAKLYPTSPVAHVEKVKAPVLLLLGLDDQRVVNVQGKTFYHALKGQGKEVDMLVFKGEGHPLDGVEAARVGWEATVDWFAKTKVE